ncbi:UDP-glucosyltransferase 2-like [Phymastichus coffea]|uniref:UDP-glucosyltransferase 2-like n=1 Tax=Phymastichus coffea TaxID=108790 RepID=UPI00273AE9E6|nr:UDP-glucosyltransferase 2-like [Phymastichus coffea]XP_058795221.1 UDP-glucosyltransferase 2-like [Phymastichus coffea]
MLLSAKSTTLGLIMIWLCCTVQTSNVLRILGIFPFQMKSQFVMGEELLKALAAKGHQVDVYSHFPLKNPIPNYNDISLEGTLPALTNNVTIEAVTSIPDTVQLMDSWYRDLCHPICDLLRMPQFQKLIRDPPKDPPYDIIIMEFSMTHCFIPFGRHLNVPVIGVQALPLYPWQYDAFRNPVNLASEPNFVTSYFNPMSFPERIGNFITHNRLIRLAHKYSDIQNNYILKYFGEGFPHAADLLKDVALMFVVEDFSLFGAKAFMPKIVPVAGLHIANQSETLAKQVQEWLDESTNGCVVFTFGSMIKIETLPRHIIEAFYKSFENIAPVRVLMKIAKPELLPAGLPSNVLTQTWLQQGAVLKHENTRAFVTHGGLMGTQESIYYEVPMIGIPIFFDQHYTLNTYASKKIAIKLPLYEVTEATFTHALRQILQNPKYRENVQKVSRQMKDRPVSVMDTALFWVQYVHRHGKDALKSASEDMPWWQVSLLDVYASLVTLSLLAVFICIQLLKLIFKILISSTRKSKTSEIKKRN